MNQLQIHKKIDDFFRAGTNAATVDAAQELIVFNEDSRRYFFSQANHDWLEWIWENGLLKDLNKKVKDITKYSYRMPELEYLTRMAETQPKIVTDIIISTPISNEAFNPEVIERFFWIIEQLPASEIRRILPNVLSQNWIKLMAPFRQSGYQYRKMVERLKEAKDYESLLILTQVILAVRAKKEFSAAEKFSISDNFFYLNDVSETSIFETLTNDNPSKEETLKILLKVFDMIVDLGKTREETIFEKTEPFYLLDVDIFNLDLDSGKRSHAREDIQNFVATCKKLIEAMLSSACGREEEARRLYENYIFTVPDSLTGWRFKLFAITRCPQVFKEEIRSSLFRIFEVGERYFEINSGAEYHQALVAGFSILDKETTQREYVSKVFDYFGADIQDKDREKWRKRDGLEILTYIKGYLTLEEIRKAEEIFGKSPLNQEIAPHPSMGKVTSGFVTHKSPFNPAEYSIDNLIQHLKTDANPKVLNEEYKNDDFLNPRGPEGLADALKEDFKIRRSEYLANLNKFFDRDSIDPSYIYAILRQIEDMIRAKEVFTNEEFLEILNFFDHIRGSGEQKEFNKTDESSYLANWTTVHKSMADISLEILGVIKDSQLFRDNREKILSLVKYLLSIKNSPDSDDEKREADDPANVAINSVRGQAFRAFVQFTYNEGNKTLADDVKVLYESILDNDFSNAVRFTIGQFLASFYYRDVEFIKTLLPKIFPKGEINKEKEYFATWEGYLSSSLFKELFDELKIYYEYAINIDPNTYPDRKYLAGLDETLAVHLALAYAHLDLKIGDPLFDLFWRTPNETRHYEFVSFIGRSCITRSQAGDKWLEENKVSKEKLVDFWNWIITTTINIETKAFSGFGFWINPDTEVIDEKIIIKNLPVTLKKSQGEIDWDYGFTKKLKRFAELDPQKTLEVIKDFLLLNNELNSHRRSPLFSLEGEIKEALKIIYQDEALKKDVEDLINLLIEKGSSAFWGLKDVLK